MRLRQQAEPDAAEAPAIVSRAEWLRSATAAELEHRRDQLEDRYRHLRSRPSMSREEAHGRVDMMRKRAQRELDGLLNDSVTVSIIRTDPPIQAGIADVWAVATDDTLAKALHDRIDQLDVTPPDVTVQGCLTHETRDERVGEQQELRDQIQAITDEFDRRAIATEKEQLEQRESRLLARIRGGQQ